MKSFYQILQIVIMATILLASCSDDDLYRTNQLGSELIEMDGVRYSSFTISNKIVKIPANLTDVLVKMRSSTSGASYDFKAKVKSADVDRLTCMIPLGKDQKLPDGDYEMTIKAKENAPGVKITVAFIDEMLYEINSQQVDYPLGGGDGTKENPYIIASSDDFDMFLFTLARYDTLTYGRGLYFKQTASIDLSTIESFQSGKGYYGAPFAGHYDGGGSELQNLSYAGEYESKDQSISDTDDYIGLFTKLLNGATVQNLIFRNLNMRGIRFAGGAVAGASSGNVSISNITLLGSIYDCGNFIGGLVGHCQGTVNISHITSSLIIKGKEKVGGCIGIAENAIVSISDVTFKNTSFSVQSTKWSGGLIGQMTGSCTIDNVSILHLITSEDNNMKVIFSNGDNCGGLIGELTSQEKIAISNINIYCPVRSEANNVGGLIGRFTLSHDLEITNSNYYSFLAGKSNVGGFIGCLLGNNNCSVILKGNNRLMKKDDGNGKIEGTSKVGGMVGYLSQCLLLDISNPLEVAINVSASADCSGGLVGYALKSSIQTGGFSSSDGIRIEGGTRVGGLIGYADYCNNLFGPTAITLSKQNPIVSIPSANTFESKIKGHVFGSEAVGGVIGEVFGSKSTAIKGLSSSAHLMLKGTSFSNVGGIIGKSFELKKIEQCVYRGVIKGDAVVGSSYMGGIVGGLRGDRNTVDVVDCINYGEVYGDVNIGGIVGGCEIEGEEFHLKYNVNCGKVVGKESVGGIVGYTKANPYLEEYKKIDACANYGLVKGVGKYSSSSWVGIGGIVGNIYHNRSSVTRCANHGEVIGNGRKYCLGGIGGKIGLDAEYFAVEQNYSIKRNCNYGQLSSDHSDSHIGGIAGFIEEGYVFDKDQYALTDCYNAGPITSDQSSNNGGIVGYVDHSSGIYRTINTGLVSSGNAIVGVRKSGAVIYHEYNYYLTGTGKDWYATAAYTTKDASVTSSFKTFDFNSVWILGDAINNGSRNNGFPYLRDCPFQWTTYSDR